MGDDPYARDPVDRSPNLRPMLPSPFADCTVLTVGAGAKLGATRQRGRPALAAPEPQPAADEQVNQANQTMRIKALPRDSAG